MKNVVVEIDGPHAVILTDAGDFKKIVNTSGLKVGDVFFEKSKAFIPRVIRAAVSVAAVFILGFMASYYYLTFTPHGYIDIRINPGIKLTLNAMDKVIGAEGLNDDGQLLLQNIAQKESDPRKAIEIIVSKAAEMGFFKAGNPVRITVAMQNQDKVAKMENDLMATAQDTLKINSVDVPVSAFSIDVQDYKSLDVDRDEEKDDTDTTDYSPAWKEKTVKPSICDVKFSGRNIIIEFNHNLTLDNAKVYAYSDKNPAEKLEATIIDSKNDKLTVSFQALTPGEAYKLEASGITNKDGTSVDPVTARIIQPMNRFADSEDQSAGKTNNDNAKGHGKGNGNAYGNEKDDGSDTDEVDSASPTPGTSDQQSSDNSKKGKGNAYGHDKQKQNEEQDEDIDNDQGKENGDIDENDGTEDEDKNDEDRGELIPAPNAMIRSIDLAEGKYRITFNLDLSFSGIKVTATKSKDSTNVLTGQATVTDSRTLLVAFPALEPDTAYVIQVENAALKDGTKLGILKINYETLKDGKTNHGKGEDKKDNWDNEDSEDD